MNPKIYSVERPSAHQRGQSLVEIALVLPALVILLLGIAEVGFFLFSHVQIANAARAGARHGSLCRLNDNCANLTTVVQSAVFNEAQSLDMDGTNSSVNVQPNPAPVPVAVGSPITVTVTYTHTPPFISSFVPMFPAEIPIQHRVIMDFDR
jgi:Flp pilus assembly protein TadG